MTPEDSIYRFRLRTLALAEELGSVCAACRAMGIHHSTFYRWKGQAEQYGLELLRPCERPTAAEGQRDESTGGAARGLLRAGSARLRSGAHRGQAGATAIGRHPVLSERRLAGAQAPPAELPGQASGPGCGLRGRARTGTVSTAAGPSSGGRSTRLDGAVRLLPRWPFLRDHAHPLAVPRDRCGHGLHLDRA